jgi:hypothetical protein
MENEMVNTEAADSFEEGKQGGVTYLRENGTLVPKLIHGILLVWCHQKADELLDSHGLTIQFSIPHDTT